MMFNLEERAIPEPNSGCLIWLGSLDTHGYGHFFRKGKTYLVHRVAFENVNGPIKNGLHVLHTCDNPACCNPDHLFLGTDKDNAADRVKKGRSADKRGGRNPNAKLTAEEIKAIRAAPGLQREIAARYRIPQTHVSRIKLRRSWAHV